MKHPGNLWIGTSNITMAGNKTTFPPEFQNSSRLKYYSHLFTSVEMNSSFYKIPRLSTVEKWREETQPRFTFSMKVHRDITHIKDLQTDFACLQAFMDAASAMEHKKGCLLVQFPGKITLEYFSGVQEILSELQHFNTSPVWRIAVEFRDPSWYISETRELLAEYNAVAVMHDFRKARLDSPLRNSDFYYIRFHGPAGDYRGSYTNEYLQEKAAQFDHWLREGKDLYIYFNNTAGQAYENALTLKTLIMRDIAG